MAVPPGGGSRIVRATVAAAGVAVALASAAWIVPAAWPTYAVFFAFAFAYSFVWLDSDAPTSVAHMATATAFVYIAGLPVLFFELMARALAYPLIFAGARRGLMVLPRPLRPLVDGDRARARDARLDLAALLGLATIGSAVRVGVVHVARSVGVESLIGLIALGEPTAYAVMGALSVVLRLSTAQYVVASPQRLPIDDERVDVIFSAVLIVPFLVLVIAYGWIEHGLIGAAAWSLTSLAPHGLVQMLIRRRHLLEKKQAALEEVRDRLAQKHAELEQLTQSVTHDLKTTVRAMAINAEALLRTYGPTLPEAAQADLRHLARVAEKAEQMIIDLLRMVELVTEPEPVTMVDLGAVTTQALEVLRAEVAAREVRVDVQAPLPTIPGQETKLRHVVMNLIGNAIRFVPVRTGTIAVSAVRDGSSVVLSVRDNGIGIPAQYHEVIFRIFRRVPGSNGDARGTGMGLAIVKRIVETHGGEVWVDSAPGEGSVFRVRLPAG